MSRIRFFDVYKKKESERYQIPAIEEEKTTVRMGQPLLSQRHKHRERELAFRTGLVVAPQKGERPGEGISRKGREEKRINTKTKRNISKA